MTKLIIVRHGESEANRHNVFIGHTDADLTENGVKQAACTAAYIAEHEQVDAIYASDLKRAFRTGQAIAEKCGLPLFPDARLREIYAGDWENVTFAALDEQYPAEYGVWKADIGHSGCAGGESVPELAMRVMTAVEDLAQRHPGQTVVLASHGTPIRVMHCLMGGKPLDDMKDIPWASNASITEALYENGAWTLLKQGYDAHLKEMRTALPENV